LRFVQAYSFEGPGDRKPLNEHATVKLAVINIKESTLISLHRLKVLQWFEHAALFFGGAVKGAHSQGLRFLPIDSRRHG